jgi:MscS family membrane protein
MVFVRVGFVITLGWSLLRFKNKLIKKTLEKNTQSIDKENLLVISKVLSVVVVILMVLLLSDVTGISVTTSLALGGIGGLALAFASQEIVANFFGGLMIHIMKPFSLGDYISIPSNEIEGVVEEIGWYQTTLRSLSNEATYVSNSLFTKGYLINKSRLTRRLLSESFFIRLEPIDLIPLIIQDITTYLNQHPSMQGGDKAEDKANVWLKSIQGTTSEVAISSSTDLTSLTEFNRLRDEVLLKIAFLVALRGGQLMPPPSNS